MQSSKRLRVPPTARAAPGDRGIVDSIVGALVSDDDQAVVTETLAEFRQLVGDTSRVINEIDAFVQEFRGPIVSTTKTVDTLGKALTLVSVLGAIVLALMALGLVRRELRAGKASASSRRGR